MLGQTPVPYEATKENGPKSLRCYGFAEQAEIRDQYLAGTGVWLVVPQKNSTVADKMMTALTTAMRDTELAMICRYKHNVNGHVKMMVLLPNHNSMLMYELIYKQNVVRMSFPTLRTTEPTTVPSAEQYEAVDKLIDALDMMNVGEDTVDGEAGGTEAFKILQNPAYQHTCRAITMRSLYPNEAIISLDEDLIEMLNMPEELKDKSKPHVGKIKKLFPLETVTSSATDQTPGIALEKKTKPVEVGIISPVEDFLDLLNHGEHYPTAATQIQHVINNLVLEFVAPVEDAVAVEDEKVLKAIITFREQAKLLGPNRYNKWLDELKTLLLLQNKAAGFIDLLQLNGLGLITNKENDISLVSEKQATAFYIL